jgi:DNA-binding MarR family transcriptional regulator
MSRPPTVPAPLSPSLGEELARELSARTILFHQAIADKLGLNLTDHRCLDLAQRASSAAPLTAGQLAELTGLTTGAITGVLDRLEKAGFIRREKDPNDRRQLFVRVREERIHEIDQLFQSFREAWLLVCSRYSEAELELIGRFTREVADVLHRETDRLRGDAPEPNPDAYPLSAPLGAIQHARLELAKGGSNLTLGSTADPVLYRGRYVGPAPRLSVEASVLRLQYARSSFRLFDWSRHELELLLTRSVPWSLQIRGGATKLNADLSELELSGIEIRGGAHQVALKLPEPNGSVSVRIADGANQVTILRPARAAARLRVTSGAAGLVIDSLRLGSVGGETRWESPDFENAKSSFDIEVLSGANMLSVGTY